MVAVSKKKQVVEYFLSNQLLLSADFFDSINPEFDESEFNSKLSKKINTEQFLILFKDLFPLLEKTEGLDLNWRELEKSLVLREKGRGSRAYDRFIEFASLSTADKGVKVVVSYKEEPKKREPQDFVSYFTMRYKALESLLRGRTELTNLGSISRIIKKKEKEAVSLIGVVKEKQVTKNKNIILTLEDNTGQINILVNKNKTELYNMVKDVVLDEVLGATGANSDNIVFANNIIWPDTPLDKPLKKAKEEGFVIFLSDLHVGSNKFLEEQLQKFISWIRGEVGTEKQKEMAKKVKYIFIVGDLVDGVGVYPGQETELDIEDIYEQYRACAELLDKIPQNIEIIICPGNHDAGRLAEPQPAMYKDFAKPLWSLPNVTMVSNPAVVNIHASQEFEGFDVLLYHGYSFDYYVANVDSIRNNGGYDRPDLLMKFLLKRRHLAPTHTSTLYVPDPKKDPLVIKKIPDFFVTGHIHKASIANYRNITMVCGSCWQSKTGFQQKVGHHPEPCRVPIVNLKTRAAKMLRFN